MQDHADTVAPRSPDEILADFDAACSGQRDIDPREVLFEVIEDLLDSLGRYAEWPFDESSTPAEVVLECKGMLTDYVVNNYGDD